MLQDVKIQRAISEIQLRSEREEDSGKLVEIFFDIGILAQVQNVNHQIIFGRRGTGKTHLLRVLESKLKAEKTNVIVSIDARTLGSSQQYMDQTLPIHTRCLALFRDILTQVHAALVSKLFENDIQSEEALTWTNDLLDAISAPTTSIVGQSLTEAKTSSSDATDSTAIELGVKGVQLKLGESYKNKGETRLETTSVIHTSDKVVFPALHGHLVKILKSAGLKLYLLLDEWSSFPSDIQPFLAEFLKRGVIPCTSAVVKIAALEYRSHFALHTPTGVMGFEVGADIATSVDLDDYYVFDRDPKKVTFDFGAILLRHLASVLPENYLSNYGINNSQQLATRLFTQTPVMEELARAAEGVVRDLINIFTRATFISQRKGLDSIDKRSVIEAAQNWFENDKSRSLSEDMHKVLSNIVKNVIGQRRARSFLLPRNLERNELVQKLIDARVLHLVRKGYADKDNPGIRYSIYTLDYGTYVDLIGTSAQPQLRFTEDLEKDQGFDKTVVPFDDKRSIRRIILNEKDLKP